MTKKRRERDRPKAAHHAPYHPNKRVLLSYASDEEKEDEGIEEPVGTGHPGVIDEWTADYQIQEYGDDDEQSVEASPEALRSPNDDENAADNADEGVPAAQSSSRKSRTIGRNISTNQYPALGSLSFQWDAEKDSEEMDGYDSAEEEAMAYLKAVRYERQQLPSVLTAPQPDAHAELYESGVGDSRGYVIDGTYIGRPEIGPSRPEAARTFVSAQEAFTAALKNRILEQRHRLRNDRSPEASSTLDERHPVAFPPGDNKFFSLWLRCVKNTSPIPTQIQALEQDTVYKILEMIRDYCLVQSRDIDGRISAWVWSLFARLDDVGTMDNDQVSELREFGKKAVLVQLSLEDAAAARQLDAIGNQNPTNPAEIVLSEAELDSVDGNASEVASKGPEANDSVGQKPLPDSERRQNTLATLDMILVVVGDLFGQRDLLEFRRHWDAADQVANTNTN